MQTPLSGVNGPDEESKERQHAIIDAFCMDYFSELGFGIVVWGLVPTTP